MTPERWQRVQELFLQAAELPPGERAAFLAERCGSDDALRARVERMLALDEEPASLLDELPAAVIPATDPAGRRVGPYRIVGVLGRGGMGTVYLAERDDVGKRVALKLVRGALAAPETVERFLLERRVLARLEHPHIAQLFDAGFADDGTPYFAMEYVRGQPIDRYCDAHRLSVDERLALFEMVCAAVAMAHASGIVHRDLKPGNILVTDPGTQESGGQVKLLDFGIAKVLEEGWGQGAVTRSDVRPMTPEFAAPEQLAGGAITPATDVYALGILLYRLLCGHPVRPGRGCSSGGSGERASDTEPPPPSVMAGRVTNGDERLTPEVIARARSTTPERLCAELDGDLDRITRAALAPDPRDRYPTATELLEDVRRCRAGLAPRAVPARRRVRVSRPQRLAAGAVLALLLLLLAGMAIRAWITAPLPPAGGATVAVLPFGYLGALEHAYLGDGIVSLLGTAFNGVEGVRAVEPRALLGFVARGRRGNEAPGGREVARHFGAALYVTGEVVEANGHLRIGAALRDTANRALAGASVEGRADSLFALIDEVAARLLAGMLGGSEGSLARSAALTSHSLPALQAYLQGESALRAGDFNAAADAFDRAVTADPTFALAHYRMSIASTWVGRSVFAVPSARRAVQLAGQLGQIDSLRVVGWLHYLTAEPLQAAQHFQTITLTRPEDIDAWYQLGETQYHWLPSLGHPATAARTAFERVLHFEPDNLAALLHLASIAAAEGDLVALDTLAGRLLRLEAGDSRATEMAALRAFAAGDSAEQRRIARDLGAGDPSVLQAVVRALARTGVDPPGVAALARMLARTATSPEPRGIGALHAAYLLAASGRMAEAREELSRYRAWEPQLATEARAALALLPLGDTPREELTAAREALARVAEVEREPIRVLSDFEIRPFPAVRLYLLGMLSYRSGDEPGALRYAARLEQERNAPSYPQLYPYLARLIRAQVLRSHGQAHQALRSLGPARILPDSSMPQLLRHYKAHERWLRAELHREVGDDTEALRWYASFPDPTGYDVAYLPASHLRRAELHERRGERDRATTHYRRYVELWRDADPELQPLVRQARERVER